jgi:hypothetical protein
MKADRYAVPSVLAGLDVSAPGRVGITALTGR